jgi:hypothetical protein
VRRLFNLQKWPSLKINCMIRSFKYFILLFGSLFGFFFHATAQTSVHDVRGSGRVVPLISEPAPKLIVEPPLKDLLQLGKVIIQYHTENIRILSVLGQTAVDVSPRIGHLHITVDNAPWHWAHTTIDPLIVVGLTEGSHRILIELADPAHNVIDSKTVTFTIPSSKDSNMSHH